MTTSSPTSSTPTDKLDLRVIVEVPLRLFAPWLAMVLVVTWAGYPGVVCVTPMAWLLALRVGPVCVTRSTSSSPRRRLLEAALAGGWFGFLQGILFVVIILWKAPIRPNEQTSATLLNVGMVVVGMLAGAGLAPFTAYLVERRRRAAQAGAGW